MPGCALVQGLDVRLATEASWEALQAGHFSKSFLPECTPALLHMDFQQLPGGSARRVSHFLAGALENLGASAVSALHAAGLATGKEVAAMAAAG